MSKVTSMVISQAKNPPPIEPNRLILGRTVTINNVIPFGVDNLFPNRVAENLRRSKIQRGILNDKLSYFAGSYFTSESQSFLTWEKTTKGKDSFFKVHKKLIKDDLWNGNSYLHLITDARKSFLTVEHLDFTRCRVDADKRVVFNEDWKFRLSGYNDKVLPLFPVFERNAEMYKDNLYHSVIHFKDYEPEFEWYGIPDWVVGWENMSIDIRTDEWNLSHLDKGMKPDIIMHLPLGTTEAEIEMIRKDAKEFKEGKPGSLMFTFGDGVRSTVLNAKMLDMDWGKLTESNLEKSLIANSWYKSLMSVSSSTGFDTNRVLYEYQLALRKIIPKQESYLEIYRELFAAFNIDATDLQIFNEPILPESKSDKIIKLLPLFSESQRAELSDKYFMELMQD